MQLATGYAPFLIQMYATAAFSFDQSSNGWLMAEFALVRGIFLILVFPPIIDWGRRIWKTPSTTTKSPTTNTTSSSTNTNNYNTINGGANGSTNGNDSPDQGQFPTSPSAFESASNPNGPSDLEPVKPPPVTARESYHFDLVFLRWSLVVDGALTTVAAYATAPWHIYLSALLLPLGSGSAPAAKGVITDMCPDSQRADALNAVTLIENVARLATQGLFGFVFAALAEQGKAYATFFCNAAVAVVGMAVLLLSHFPPDDARLLEDDEYAALLLSEESTAAATPEETEDE